MKADVIQRVRCYLKSNGVTITNLATSVGMPIGTLTNKLNGQNSLDLDTLCLILEQFPDLSAEWLLRGTEPMTMSEQSSGDDEKLRQICIEQCKRIYDLEHELAGLKGESQIKHA